MTEVKVGDKVTDFRNTTAYVVDGQPPHKDSACGNGRALIIDMDGEELQAALDELGYPDLTADD